MTRSYGKNIFLLSPANLAGRRATFLLSPKSEFELAIKLRSTGASIGEIFSFVSGLYFRGKLAYANAFSETDASTTAPSVYVITATRGLISPAAIVTLEDLAEMAVVPISSNDPRYRMPLHRDATELAGRMTDSHQLVLLGSVATSKYLEPLSHVFGSRLSIPAAFVGLGDMSRGSILLRAVRDRVPLAYITAPELKAKPAMRAKAAKRFKKRSSRPPSTRDSSSGRLCE